MLISIAIPCYRSEKTLPSVVSEIQKVFSAQDKFEYEIILVNDGSPDNVFSVIQKLCEEDEKITGINLSQNFGQSNAKMAAMPYVNGDILITMDDDGQHPASGIIDLANKILEGYDVVYAYFPEKKHSAFKRITSKLNGFLLSLTKSKASDVKISSFIAYSAFAINVIKNNNSPVTALSSYVRKLTKKVTNIEMEHRARLEGKSTYTLKRMIKLWRNGITSFNTTMLTLSIYLGFLCAGAGFLYALVIIIQKLLNPSLMMGYASIMVSILMLSGLIMLLIGVLGEYVGKIFLIMVNLPNYQVRDQLLNVYSKKDKKDA